MEAYRDMGILPEAMRNYLLRLGWGHGDDEIIGTEQAINWFNIVDVGRSPSRMDMDKLFSLNGHYLREADDERLVTLVADFIVEKHGLTVDQRGSEMLFQAMKDLKPRAKTLVDMADGASFLVRPRPLPMDAKAEKILANGGRDLLAQLLPAMADLEWTASALEQWARDTAETRELKLGKVAQPIRAALSGSTVSPPIFEVMEILGRDESLARIRDAVEHIQSNQE